MIELTMQDLAKLVAIQELLEEMVEREEEDGEDKDPVASDLLAHFCGLVARRHLNLRMNNLPEDQVEAGRRWGASWLTFLAG